MDGDRFRRTIVILWPTWEPKTPWSCRALKAPNALPLAMDYLFPYAEARTGTLDTGEGISAYGFHVPTGAYHIVADGNDRAEIAFDLQRGESRAEPIAYAQPALVVLDLNVPDLNVPDQPLRIELSQDSGTTFETLPASWYNLATCTQSVEPDARTYHLLQLLCPIPITATGNRAWVLRVEADRSTPLPSDEDENEPPLQ